MTPTEKLILQSLARYRFLTSEQMVKLGISKSRSFLRSDPIPHLKAGKLIKSQPFGLDPVPGVGRLHDLIYLTEKGVKTIAELEGVMSSEIKYPKYGVTHRVDYDHRLAYIDLCIATDLFFGMDMVEWKNYFDKVRVGDELRADTRIYVDDWYIEADGIFDIKIGAKRRLYAVEVHNERTPAKILDQLERHTGVLRPGALAHMYERKESSRVLNVFVDEDKMKAVVSRLDEIQNFRKYQGFFMFALLGRIENDFKDSWFRRIDGNDVPFDISV